MFETIWKNIKAHEGELFYTTGTKHLELTYEMADEEHVQFSRTAELVSRKSFQRVYEYMDTLTPAQINQKVRASYYILALLTDQRITC